MNWDNVEDKWKQLTSSAKENWSKLSDQDFEQISGKREQLTSKLQEVYGITRREADKTNLGLGKDRREHSEDNCVIAIPIRLRPDGRQIVDLLMNTLAQIAAASTRIESARSCL